MAKIKKTQAIHGESVCYEAASPREEWRQLNVKNRKLRDRLGSLFYAL